ncbi:MAG: RDD family protein [Hyphomicrobiales bacterium]
MSTQEILPKEDVFDYPNNGALFNGVLSRRLMAFVIDFIILSVIIGITTFVLFILGIATFGLLWFFIPAIIGSLSIAIVIGYVAFTTGGEKAATPGMNALGLEVRMMDGRKLYALMAIFHGLAFYFFSAILTPFVVLVGLFTSRRRLLHDIVSGAIVVNKDALPEHLK